jgi:hypothetical protein
MKKILFVVLALGLLLGVSTGAHAYGTEIDVINSGYYFGQYLFNTDVPGGEWSWTHNPLCSPTGNIGFASLTINAYDVDLFGTPTPEVDNIYAYDAATTTWVLLGFLSGNDGVTSNTTFSLGSQLFDDIKTGLNVKIAIDTLNGGWAVTLNSSTLEICCCPAPIPGTLLLLGSGLLGLVGVGVRKKFA